MTPGPGDLDEFCAAVHPRLVGLVAAMAGGTEDAEAIVQDAFVALIPRWSRIVRYDDPEAWVRQVAVRTLVSRRRRSRVAARFLPRLLEPAGAAAPTGAIVVAVPRASAAASAPVLSDARGDSHDWCRPRMVVVWPCYT